MGSLVLSCFFGGFMWSLVCKRTLKTHCIVIKGVELCWKKEETTCIFDIGKVPPGLPQVWIFSWLLLQLGMCNWGYEAGVGGTRCHINSDKTCQAWIYFIYKIRIATIFNQSIYQQTNQLRKKFSFGDFLSVLLPLDLVKRRNFKQHLVFSWIPPLSC